MHIVRYNPPGTVHHIISRFVDKRWFISSDREREHYLGLLAKALTKTDWICLSYALMSSHIHLAMIAGELPAESWSRRVNPPFANWFNTEHERIGPLFAAPARMWISRAENVGDLIAYIHNNPVRGGVVERAAYSTWTSHRAYVGGHAPPWLRTDKGLQLAGLNATDFDRWVDSRSGMKMDEAALEPIRRSARRDGAFELGTPIRSPLEVPIVSREFAHVRPNPLRVVELTAEISGIAIGDIRSHDRNALAVAGRTIAIRAGKTFGVSMSSTGAAIGISAQAAARLGSRPLDETGHAVLNVVRDRLEGELVAMFTKEKVSTRKRPKPLAAIASVVDKGESLYVSGAPVAVAAASRVTPGASSITRKP